jgi:hypothetical protein
MSVCVIVAYRTTIIITVGLLYNGSATPRIGRGTPLDNFHLCYPVRLTATGSKWPGQALQ